VIKKIFVFALVLTMWLTLSAHAATDPPFRVGVLPTLSAKVLLTNYQPLRVYLERELQRPVELFTAPDFKRFHQDALAGDFDLVVTAPHLARLAQLDGGFQPLATFLLANRAILITAKSKPINKIEELRGRNLAIFDPLALIVLQAQEWLEDQGLVGGRDYQKTVFPSHASVAFAVQQSGSPVGVISPAGLKQLPPDAAAQIQVFAELPQTPALIWVMHPRMGKTDRIQAALLRFAETPEGAQFYAGNAYKGMRPVTAEELRSLDRSAREAKRLMQE
jgi:phosphonate transport system substrate-binding protein